MMKLLFILALLGCCLSFEFDLSLQDTYKIQIISEIDNIPLAVERDYSVPQGRVSVQIGSNAIELDASDVKTRLNDDVLEIIISGDSISEYFSKSSSSSEDTSNAAKALSPVNGMLFLLLGISFFGLFDRKFLSFMAIVLFLVVVQSIIVEDREIIVNFSPLDEITELTILSKSSVLVDTELREVCQSGTSLSNLSKCHGFVCNINDKSCISSKTQKIGSLVPLNDNRAASFTAGIEVAGNKFGNRLPETQIIISSSETETIAVKSAQKLYDMGCRHFVGPFFSANALAVLEWSQSQSEVPMIISPIASSTNLDAFNNFFSVYTSNDELGKAYCNQISETTNNRIFNYTLYAVNLDTEYTDNILSVMQTQCSFLRIQVIHVASYDSLDSIDDARPIINQLNNIIESNDNDDLSSIGIMHFGFGEIKYLLEALGETSGPSNSVFWFSSDAAFDKFAVSSSQSRNTGAHVGLTSMTFIGFNSDISTSIRRETLAEITQLSGSVDFWSTFAHDSAMLMYITIERMGELSDRLELFPSYLHETSRSLYGATGYLGIGQNRFRELNEFLVGYPASDEAIYSFDWIAMSYLRYNSHGRDTLSFEEEVQTNDVKYYIFKREDIDCDDFVAIAEVKDYLNIPYTMLMFPESFNEFNGAIEIPQFSNITIVINCDNEDKSGVIFCPPNTRHDKTRCLQYSNDFVYDLPSNFLAKNSKILDPLTMNGENNSLGPSGNPPPNSFPSFPGTGGPTVNPASQPMSNPSNFP